MKVLVHRDAGAAGHAAAQLVAEQLRAKPDTVLGLPTGDSPRTLYDELIRMHREEQLDFSRVTTFNLDEYLGLPADHPCSFHRFMHRHLFAHINARPERLHLPDGMAAEPAAHAAAYEQAIRDAGGIDLQILGIGANGHVGFNEPGTAFDSRTGVRWLAAQTRLDNARFFDGDRRQVPQHALSMGLGTIMEARRCLLLAAGEHKAAAVAAAVKGPVTSAVPASILQDHRDVLFFIDEAAASGLKRMITVGPDGNQPSGYKEKP
jgi:glucosamine-6-phosphate deaminase